MRNAVARVKTSFDYPLVVNRLRVPGYAGSLGLTFCPGKKAESMLDQGTWNRQLSVDIEQIVAWGATTLVSLIEGEEFTALGVEELPVCAAQAGLDWMHLPIRDSDVPGALFLRQWDSAGRHIHSVLQAGDNVVLHCRGGLGRTGLVAAQVLIEVGVPPVVAIRKVRKARPNTIENKRQEDYLLSLGPLHGGRE
jgi:ADP-ribosyl-[dinitrogen reductase] hydrolase